MRVILPFMPKLLTVCPWASSRAFCIRAMNCRTLSPECSQQAIARAIETRIGV